MTTTTTGYPAKRARTRAALLSGAMTVMARTGRTDLTAAPVALAAGVSTATLYNHFDGVEELEAAVAEELCAVFQLGADTVARLEGDPAGRVSAGVMRILALPSVDRRYAQALLVALAGHADVRRRVRDLVAGEVGKGVAIEEFHVRSQSVVTDALLGTVVQALRSQLLDESKSEHTLVVEVCLLLLGVDPSRIGAIVERASGTPSR